MLQSGIQFIEDKHVKKQKKVKQRCQPVVVRFPNERRRGMYGGGHGGGGSENNMNTCVGQVSIFEAGRCMESLLNMMHI